jgi:hypothetical protein
MPESASLAALWGRLVSLGFLQIFGEDIRISQKPGKVGLLPKPYRVRTILSNCGRLFMNLKDLAPADKQAVAIYFPYYNTQNKRQVLPFAITLYKQGSIEGERQIEGGASIPFVSSWFVSNLPADMTRCRLQFNNDSDLNYELTLSNHEFIDFLIDMLIDFKRTKKVDFPQVFYRRLMQYDAIVA